jgi:hypothetical protein
MLLQNGSSVELENEKLHQTYPLTFILVFALLSPQKMGTVLARAALATFSLIAPSMFELSIAMTNLNGRNIATV